MILRHFDAILDLGFGGILSQEISVELERKYASL